MPKPREELVSLDATPYYHCVSRCVRRAFLCGEDALTGKNFEHRRGWIRNRMLELADIFAIDVCAYAVMSNHYHVVLHVADHRAEKWSDSEVIRRWHRLFAGIDLSRRFDKGEPLGREERRVLSREAQRWRTRLHDISWFMRCLNEAIARQANAEDQCTGRFWEGRFKSQALLDEKALAACLAYVDLNPIRAGMADTPETSEYTSAQARIETATKADNPSRLRSQVQGLFPFAGNPRKDMPEGLPFRLTDYLELLDWSGRLLREDKRGAIPEHLPPILERLGLDARQWRYLTTKFESPFKGLVGAAHRLRKACETLGYERPPGVRACEVYLS